VKSRKAIVNYWPAVADLMLAMCIIALALGLLSSVLAVLQSVGGLGSGPDVSLEEFNKLKKENALLLGRLAPLEAALADLQAENERLRKTMGDTGSSNKPPVIVIGSKEISFDRGSAELGEFKSSLEQKQMPKILGVLREFRGKVDTLVIVGHTDSKPLQQNGNLDSVLQLVLDGAAQPESLKAGSNSDLGLMRAVAVRGVLKPLLDANGWAGLPIICLSAANGVPPEEPLGEDGDAKRRRIEVMFLGLKAQ
jgi:outer membrane protein OmpA-like peptidoglycan-associated protein